MILFMVLYSLIVTGLYLGLLLLSMKYLAYPWYLFPIILGGLALAFGIMKLTVGVLGSGRRINNDNNTGQ